MRLLALDASGPVLSIAAAQDGAMLYEAALCLPKAHAVHLAPMLEEMLSHTGLAIKDFDGVVCVVGPGSFTGVRIGVATAQGLAFGAGLSCAPVNALEALASTHSYFNGLVCPILDARAGQVYAAAFQNGKRILPDTALPLHEYLASIQTLHSGQLLFVGDGVPAHHEAITTVLADQAAFSHQPLRASDAALIALRPGQAFIPPGELRPIYLRAPQAERERAKRQAESHA